MGGVVKKIIKPFVKMPAMPEAPPEPEAMPEAPAFEDTTRAEEVAEKRASIRRNRKGRSSTILTTADGLEDDEITTKKTLLGG